MIDRSLVINRPGRAGRKRAHRRNRAGLGGIGRPSLVGAAAVRFAAVVGAPLPWAGPVGVDTEIDAGTSGTEVLEP